MKTHVHDAPGTKAVEADGEEPLAAPACVRRVVRRATATRQGALTRHRHGAPGWRTLLVTPIGPACELP